MLRERDQRRVRDAARPLLTAGKRGQPGYAVVLVDAFQPDEGHTGGVDVAIHRDRTKLDERLAFDAREDEKLRRRLEATASAAAVRDAQRRARHSRDGYAVAHPR